MDFSHIFLFFFFLFFFPTLITAQSCSVSKCINDDFAIRFPFRIPDQQPARCGYPGFNLAFLSCPPQFTMSHFPIIGCLSNSTNSVLATSSTSFVKSMSTSCTIMTTLPVPVSNPDEANQFSTNLNGDLVLTWYSPACGICETEGRLCGYKSNSGQGIALNFRGKQWSQSAADYMCGDSSSDFDVCLWTWLFYLLRKVEL